MRKVALITGSARRIGAQIAMLLHEHDYNVIIHYRNSKPQALQLARQLNNNKPNSAITVQADLSHLHDIKKLAHQAKTHWQRLDVLINNAAMFYPNHLGNVDSMAWNSMLDTNLKAPFFLAQELISELKRNKGTIVNITDVYASLPLKSYSLYSISKAGLSMLTKALAKELAPDIRVNAVAPGNILWPEQENTLDESAKEKILTKILLKRQGDPRDIAKTVLFLLQEDYITGQTISVDGGKSI